MTIALYLQVSCDVTNSLTNIRRQCRRVKKMYFLFAIMTYVVVQCVQDCSGHGQCVDYNVCVCFPGYAGKDCSQGLLQ